MVEVHHVMYDTGAERYSASQMPSGQETTMARYRMDGGTIVDTDKASDEWSEGTYWDGRNHISCATGDQWTHECLYRSRKGRYYVEHSSDWQGARAHCEWVSPHEAVRWLLANGYDEKMPDELRELVDDVTE